MRAPVDGQVLQLKVHLGEFAPVAATAAGEPPLILLGSVTPLHVRVDVDENDAWRVRTGAPASGYLRGNKNIKTPLTFVRFEPYVVPKKSLTGDSTERVDTRVLQVIFSFERGDLPIFVGQQMDVFIDFPQSRRNPPRTRFDYANHLCITAARPMATIATIGWKPKPVSAPVFQRSSRASAPSRRLPSAPLSLW